MKRTPELNKFLVIRKGRKTETIVNSFDDIKDARTFRENHPRNKNLYVTPYINSNPAQFIVS